MGVIFSFISLFIVLILIIFSCVLFTNAIEHFGEKLNLSEGAVGSILAAIGTALPETIVPLVAILGTHLTDTNVQQGYQIGIGAILGAPFMLGTLAFFVTGVAVIIYAKTGRRSLEMPINETLMLRDLHFFGMSYFIAIISSLLPIQQVKWFVALLLLVIYGIYAFKTIHAPYSNNDKILTEELESLYFSKFIKLPERFMIFLIISQVLIALAGIIFLAHTFVNNIKYLALFLKINPLILSLLITPIATELPEKLNSVIWIRAKKDTLALGNITGAMVFQSCIPTAIGLALTPWVLPAASIINVTAVYLSVIVVYVNIVKNKGVLKPSTLLWGGLFYLIFILYVVLKIINA